jgi:hypothetical protein
MKPLALMFDPLLAIFECECAQGDNVIRGIFWDDDAVAVAAQQWRLPAVIHFWFGPIGLYLTHVFLDNHVIIGLGDIAAIFVVIDPFLAVAVDHSLPQQFDRFVRHLTFSRALFHISQKRHWVLGSTSLC